MIRVQRKLEHAAVGEEPFGIPAVICLHGFIPVDQTKLYFALQLHILCEHIYQHVHAS